MAGEKKAQGKLLVVQNNSAEGLIQQAIATGANVEVMERLLAMRTQLKAEKAKEAFDTSMAQFQAECPVIKKTKDVQSQGRTIYSYAPVESIVVQVRDALRANGFSYAFEQVLTPETVKVGCIVTHIGGHSKTTWMEVRLGTKTGVMSNSQQDAAASTFAKRYAFCNAFAILTGDEDNDGANLEPRTTYRKPEPQPEPIVVYDEEPFTSPREELARLLSALGVDFKDRKAAEQFVADNTELALVESNFPEIVQKLKTLKK